MKISTRAAKKRRSEMTFSPTSQRERHMPAKYANKNANVHRIQGNINQRWPLIAPYISKAELKGKGRRR